MDRQFWLQGGWLRAGWQTLHAWGVFRLLRRLVIVLLCLSVVGLMLWLAWAICHSASWPSTVAPFLRANPPVVVVLIVSLALPLFWLLLWKLPQWQVTYVFNGFCQVVEAEMLIRQAGAFPWSYPSSLNF